MKNATVWDKVWYVFLATVGLMFLIPFLITVYWFIFGIPDADTDYLSWDTEVAVEKPWINDDFEIEITNVQIGNADENGLRPCEIIMKVVNHDIVTHRSSRDLMTFVHCESDSIDAYRGGHGTAKPDEIGEKPEKAVKNVMEIWIEHGLTSFFVEKGRTAFFVYQASVPETVEDMTLTLQVCANKKHNEQYRREYIINIEDYLKEVTE